MDPHHAQGKCRSNTNTDKKEKLTFELNSVQTTKPQIPTLPTPCWQYHLAVIRGNGESD